MKTQMVTSLNGTPARFSVNWKKIGLRVLITQHGIPTAYLVVTFEALQNRMRLLEGVACGERAIQEGRTSTHVQTKKQLQDG